MPAVSENGSVNLLNSNKTISIFTDSERRTTWVAFLHGTFFLTAWVLAVFGILGNCLVIGDLFRKCNKQECRRDKKTSSVLLLHLAVADLLVILTTCVVSIYENYNIKNTCIPTFAVYIAIRYSSVYTLCLLSYERYRNFVYPFNTNVTIKKVCVWVCLVWIVSFGFSLPLFFPQTQLGPHDCIIAPETNERKAYYSLLFFSQYLAPLVIIASVNFSTINYVKRNALLKGRQSVCDKQSQHSPDKLRCTVFSCKVLRILYCMLGAFAICMLPQHIINFILEFTNESTFSNNSLKIALDACYFGAVLLNAVINPFLYGAIKQKYKIFLRARFPCRKKIEKARQDNTSRIKSSLSTKDKGSHMLSISSQKTEKKFSR